MKYKVLSPIRYGKRQYRVGDQIDLPPELGEPRVQRGRLEPVSKGSDKTPSKGSDKPKS